MKSTCSLLTLAAILGLTLPSLSLAGPQTAEEARRQAEVLARLKKAVGEEKTAAARLVVLEKGLAGEKEPGLRRAILDLACEHPGPDLDEFLSRVLANDEDAGVRSLAAIRLGRLGSEKTLAALVKAAESDRTTPVRVGDVGGESSARRAALFAVAELGTRYPRLAGDVTLILRSLAERADPKDPEGLADARVQALFQVTRDESLLKPFHVRLKSASAEDRVNGVVAFQFLKLREAPKELTALLKDEDSTVRSWAALVLGEIGDAKTTSSLMAMAGDGKEDRGNRCNAIMALGRMKAKDAAELMRRLLADGDPGVRANAAIALYRITGEKVKELPEGFRPD